MKRILSLLAVLVLVCSVAACKPEENPTEDNSSTIQTVDVNIVAKVKEAQENLEAKFESNKFSYKANISANIIEGKKETQMTMYQNCKYDATSNLTATLKSGVSMGDVKADITMYINDEYLFYNDTKSTYKIKVDDDTKSYVEKQSRDFETFEFEDLPVIDTVVVNTDGGGYGFVIAYDASQFTKEQYKILSEVSDASFEDIKFTKVEVSGIIDKENVISQMALSVNYSIEDDDTSSGTTSNSKTSKTEFEFVMEVKYDFSGNFTVEIPNNISVSDAKDSTLDKLKGSK